MIQGIVKNGQIVLESADRLPEGAQVRVMIVEELPPTNRETPKRDLLDFSGQLTNLPEDFAEKHDHYIHGCPKR